MMTNQQESVLNGLQQALDRKGLVIIMADGDSLITSVHPFDEEGDDNGEEIARDAIYEAIQNLISMGYLRNYSGHPYK